MISLFIFKSLFSRSKSKIERYNPAESISKEIIGRFSSCSTTSIAAFAAVPLTKKPLVHAAYWSYILCIVLKLS